MVTSDLELNSLQRSVHSVNYADGLVFIFFRTEVDAEFFVLHGEIALTQRQPTPKTLLPYTEAGKLLCEFMATRGCLQVFDLCEAAKIGDPRIRLSLRMGEHIALYSFDGNGKFPA